MLAAGEAPIARQSVQAGAARREPCDHFALVLLQLFQPPRRRATPAARDHRERFASAVVTRRKQYRANRDGHLRSWFGRGWLDGKRRFPGAKDSVRGLNCSFEFY